jgi:hypothetical protein
MTLDPVSEHRFEELQRSLTNVTPTPEQIERIETIRAAAKVLGLSICRNAPNSRERSLALTHLEDCAMWAVKSIVLELGDAETGGV